MLCNSLFAISIVAQGAFAFPWVPRQPGVGSVFAKRQSDPIGPGSEAECPYNPNHVPAAPFNPKYPYNYAKDGLPGKGKGGYLVPAMGDTAHYFKKPNPKTDIRGPCPGLNTAANHNFLARDGITTFAELVDAQQNVYNVDYNLAVLLAVLGLTTTDGDVVTEKLSIGCDATNRTSFAPLLTGQEPGLAGHNKFEADTSLSRNDYFLSHGNDFKFNGTLFSMMEKSVQNTNGGLFNREGMAKYRYERYMQSRAENPNFYFGPFSLLLFGASSFLYELFPSTTRGLTPDLYTISSFFGAEKDSKGNWKFNNMEKLPDNWKPRPDPYGDTKVGREIFLQYAKFPVLFGGNTADGSFDAISGPHGIFKDGKLSDAVNADNMVCFLYMLTTERVPSSLNGFVTPTVKAIEFALGKVGPRFKELGCPFNLT